MNKVNKGYGARGNTVSSEAIALANVQGLITA